jgi:hypothetical protein
MLTPRRQLFFAVDWGSAIPATICTAAEEYFHTIGEFAAIGR